jgi:tetratricopeptide (TPR) repeat protein
MPEDALLANALLGGGLPSAAEEHLIAASLSYHHDEVAETHLRQAEALAPDHAAVLIGLYRFYFYKGRLHETLAIARQCLAKAQRELNLPAAWRDISPQDAIFDRFEEMMPRFFLFTLKGYAYLQMRVGNFDEGREAVDKLLELDPSDRIGAKLLKDILVDAERDDDE